MEVPLRHYAQTATSSLSRAVMYSDLVHWCTHKTVKWQPVKKVHAWIDGVKGKIIYWKPKIGLII